MANFIKWIGGGLGWAFGGPIGGIIGFLFGSMFDSMNGAEFEYKNTTGQPATTPGDFSVSLLILSAAVMRSDEKVMRSELDFVRNFFLKQFGAEYTEKQMLMLREILKQDISLPEVCQQIKQYMDYPSRLQLLHFLFGVAWADGVYHPAEVETIEQIGRLLGIRLPDYASVKAMFVRDTTSAYRILEISPEATDEEVKKAFRKMALKYHPDRVTHLGEDIQRAAHVKFQELNNAYNEIKKQRNLV
jgi:DnaJ like chaperone protein